MLNRIIRIAAVVCTLLIWTGCARMLGPAEETDGAIRFTAGSPLLRDDATKGTLKEGTAFSDGDAFLAWAWHSAAGQHLSFGINTPVTLGAGGTWDYDPHQFWNWYTGSDFYDFLAFYPADKSFSHSAATLQTPLLKASVSYDATSDQFDFMAAGLRRTEHSINTVELTFQHMLCAVSLKVKNSESSVNDGGYPLTVTLKSCKFNHIMISGSVDVTFNGNKLETMTTGSRNDTPALGPVIPENTGLSPGQSYPTSTQWDILFPQNLNPDEALLPTLEIVYNKGDQEDVEETLNLKDIRNKVTNEPITEWKAGYKYEYEIELRLGVGIMVRVTTTPWEVIEAQTPGLMI